MSDLVKVSMRLNKTAFLRGVREIQLTTNRLPGQILNRGLFSAAINARKNMPVVPASQIDSELNTEKVPRIGKRGKPLKRSPNFASRAGTATEKPLVPLGVLIALSRGNLAGLTRLLGTGTKSNFNVSTNFRYQITNFRNREMAGYISRMIKNRHSATGFFKTCAYAIQFLFQRSDRGQSGYVPQPIEGSSGGGSVSKRLGIIAGGTPATSGPGRARASFWVTSTQADTKNAVFRVAEPVWQRSIDDEGRSMVVYAREAYARALRKLGITVR